LREGGVITDESGENIVTNPCDMDDDQIKENAALYTGQWIESI
jgi:hypothetical protein